MFDWLRTQFQCDIYVRVYRDRMLVRDLIAKREVEVRPAAPYHTSRLLVGSLSTAQAALDQGIKKLFEARRLAPSPRALIQPMEMIEDGLSELEQRALKELAVSVGARSATVFLGQELSDVEAIGQLNRRHAA